MADFKQAYKKTMSVEGGLANHPADKGGLTYMGITVRDWPTWGGWVHINNARRQTGDTKVINRILAGNADLQAEVMKFYKREYWDVNKLDQIESQELAEELFDGGVNCGWKRAARWLQEALNLTNLNGASYPDMTVDGIVGPITLNRANNHKRPTLLLIILKALRGERYLEIMRNDPTQEVFANSWFSRLEVK